MMCEHCDMPAMVVNTLTGGICKQQYQLQKSCVFWGVTIGSLVDLETPCFQLDVPG